MNEKKLHLYVNTILLAAAIFGIWFAFNNFEHSLFTKILLSIAAFLFVFALVLYPMQIYYYIANGGSVND